MKLSVNKEEFLITHLSQQSPQYESHFNVAHLL